VNLQKIGLLVKKKHSKIEAKYDLLNQHATKLCHQDEHQAMKQVNLQALSATFD